MPSWKKVVLHGASGSLAHLKLENLTSQNVLGTDAQGNVVAGSVSGYTLPVATDSILGGIKVGGTLVISNGVLSARTYVGAVAAVPGEGAGVAGVAGYVPSATAAQSTLFLRGDGTWQTPTNTVTRLRSSAGTSYLTGDLMITGSGATSVSVSGSIFTVSTAAPTPYSLPIATASTLGGIKIGSGLTIDRDTGVVTAAAGTSLSVDRVTFYTGSLTLNGDGATTVSYVPQLGGFMISSTDTNTTYSAGTGLTLSGTTFSVTANTYAAANHTHDDRYLKLTDTGSFFDRIIDTAPGTLDTLNELAAAIGDDANFSSSIARVIAGKADSGHTHSDATTSAAGFMSATDKTKLDGVASNANNYSLPTATSTVLGGIKVGSNLSISSGVLSATDTNTVTSVGISGDLSTGDIAFRGGGATTISKSGGTITISSTDTDTNTTYTAGTGLTLTGTTFSVTSGTYAASSHTHTIGNVTGLQTALDGKQASGDYAAATHAHSIRDVTDLQTTLDGKQASLGFTPYNATNPSGYITSYVDTVTSVGISGDLSTGNVEFRGGGATTISKSGGTITITSTDTDTNTTYTAGTGLTLTGTTFSVTSGTYAASSHTHTIGNVTGLQTALDGKQASGDYSVSGHTHSIRDVTDLQTTLDGKLGTTDTAAAATVVTTLQNSAPSGTAGKLWWETDTGILKVYYNSTWVDAVPMPDMSLYYSKAGGAITGDVSIQQTLTVAGNTTLGGNIAVAGTVDGRDIAADGTKLDGIASGANNYSLPTATSSVLGGIKVGTNLSISNGVLSSTDTDTVTSVGISGDLSTGNVEFRGGGATTISKSGGTITISSTDTDTNTTYSAGTGLTLTGTTFSVTSGTYAASSHTHTIGNVTDLQTTLDGKQASLGFTPYNATNPSGYITSYVDTVTSVGISGDLSTGNVEFRGGGATTISKSGGTITISSTDTDTNTTYSAGTGLTLSGTTFNVSADPSFSTVTATNTTFGRTFAWYGGNLSYSSTSTGTYYRIMRVYYNQGHWGGYGTTRVKLYSSQYKGGYQEWVLKNYTGGVYLQLNDYGISPTQSGTVMTLGDAVRVGTYSGLDTFYRDVYVWLNTYIQTTYQLEVDGTYGIDADGDTSNYTKFVIWTGGNRTTGNASFPETPSTTYHSVNYAASAGAVAWTNVSGRPTAVSSFTNDAGYITSYTDTNTVTSVGISGDLSTGNVEFRGSGATTISKSGGTITISSTDTDTNTTYSAGTGLTLTGTTFSVTSGTYAASSHTHTIGNVTGLQTALDGKQASGDYSVSGHTHSIRDVTDLQTTLDGKLGTTDTAAAATNVVTIQDSAPSGTAGKLWWESDTGKLKVYYGSAWIDATPVPDMSLYYSRAGGAITGDVTVQQTLTVVGNVLVEGTLTETSDITLKENIQPLESSLDKVLKLKGVSFNKKATPEVKEIGFIAQEIEKIIPELVTETKEGIKTVSYSRVTAVLVETIKEQQAQIDKLKELVFKLTEKVNTL